MLGINAKGNEQDWEHGFADERRIGEFILNSKNANLPLEQQFALTSLIMSSYDEFLHSNFDVNVTLSLNIERIIDNNRDIYLDLLNYWAEWQSDNDDHFNETTLIRKYLSKAPNEKNY